MLVLFALHHLPTTYRSVSSERRPVSTENSLRPFLYSETHHTDRQTDTRDEQQQLSRPALIARLQGWGS